VAVANRLEPRQLVAKVDEALSRRRLGGRPGSKEDLRPEVVAFGDETLRGAVPPNPFLTDDEGVVEFIAWKAVPWQLEVRHGVAPAEPGKAINEYWNAKISFVID
jgi:hypothetical protein